MEEQLETGVGRDKVGQPIKETLQRKIGWLRGLSPHSKYLNLYTSTGNLRTGFL